MYAKIINDEVVKFPYSIAELKLDNPHTSFANNIELDFETLKQFNVFMIYPSPKPDFNPTNEKIEQGTPVKDNGKWVESWVVVALTDQEKQTLFESKADEVRAERTRLLTESDWTQFRDISEDKSALWVPYRQQLRDISLQSGFPFNVQFPVKPE